MYKNGPIPRSAHLIFSTECVRVFWSLPMGFPSCYSEMLDPKLFLRLVLLLGYLRRLISSAFDALGLGDLLDPDDPCSHQHQSIALTDSHCRPKFQSLSAILVQELLPAVRYEEVDRAAGECAVCLSEFERGDEVRRLSNCRHFFHRCCLDRWIDHEQRTCPLCRAPLFPDEMAEMVHGGGIWAAAAGVPDSLFDEDESSPEAFFLL